MGHTPDGAALAFSELRKESQDLYNRIHSIAEDAAFVDQVRRSYPALPLIREYRDISSRHAIDPTTTGSQHAMRSMVHRPGDREF
jgi:tRNA A64-2'-O-ribosylphosphate transferase